MSIISIIIRTLQKRINVRKNRTNKIIALVCLLATTTIKCPAEYPSCTEALPYAEIQEKNVLSFLHEVIIPLAKQALEKDIDYNIIEVLFSRDTISIDNDTTIHNLVYIDLFGGSYCPIYGYDNLDLPLYGSRIDGYKMKIRSEIKEFIKPIKGKFENIWGLALPVVDDRQAQWVFTILEDGLALLSFYNWDYPGLRETSPDFYLPKYKGRRLYCAITPLENLSKPQIYINIPNIKEAFPELLDI